MQGTQIRNDQRFRTAHSPCPICGGFDRMKRHQGERCYGFMSEGEEYVCCTNDAHAGSLEKKDSGYYHKLHGPCKCGVQHGDALPQRNGHKPKSNEQRQVVAEYPYYDEQGTLLFKVVRYNPKDFRQCHYESGKWIYNLQGVRRVLYRLPDLLKADKKTTVFLPEGEKDVDNLRRLGLVATCNPMGAASGVNPTNRKWLPAYSESLRGRQVAILPDNDPDGEAHAAHVAKSLKGVAAEVVIVRLPDLPDKGDVSDWLAAGGSKMQLEQFVKKAQAEQCPRPTVHRLRDLQQRQLPETRWAIDPILPEGVTLLAGKPKMGKSWLALGVLTAVSSGGVALGQYPVEGGEVLYLALEDGEKRLQKRSNKLLRDALASEDFYYTTEWPRLNEGGLDALEEWIKGHPRARLICIDTWALFKPRPQGRSTPLYDEDYSAISPLQKLAQKYEIAIIVVDHMNKREVPDDLHAMIDLVTSSTGKTGAVDGFLLLYRKLGEEGVRLGTFGRDIEEPQELVMSFNAEIVSWIVKGDVEDADVATTPARQALLDALKPFGEGATVEALEKKMGKSRHTIRCQLRDLRIAGKVQLTNAKYSLVTNQTNQTNQQAQMTNQTNHQQAQTMSPQEEMISPVISLISPVISPLINANPPVEQSNGHVDYSDYSPMHNGHHPTDPLARDKAELLSLGQQLGYPALDYRPGTRLSAGEDTWRKALLYVTKERLADMLVCAAGMKVVAA